MSAAAAAASSSSVKQAKRPRTAAPPALSDVHSSFDIVVQCALNSEAISFMQILTQTRETDFAKASMCNDPSYPYFPHQLKDRAGVQLTMAITWQMETGPTETSSYTSSLQRMVKARYWFMSGICAGLEKKTQLGDVIVAKLAVEPRGKMTKDSLEAEARTAQPSHVLLINAKGMDGERRWRKHLMPWLNWPEESKEEKESPLKVGPNLPPNMRCCTMEYLQFLQEKNLTEPVAGPDGILPPAVAMFVRVELTRAFLSKVKWNHIAKAVVDTTVMQKWTNKYLLSPEGAKEVAEHEELSVYGASPHVRLLPAIHCETIVSTPYVREDLEQVTLAGMKKDTAQRKIYGVEMEIYAFYASLQQQPTQYLAVKGVCDFGTSWKDDSFHDVAGETAAAFIKEFILQHVTALPPEATRKRKSNAAQNAGNNGDDESDEDDATDAEDEPGSASSSSSSAMKLDANVTTMLKQLHDAHDKLNQIAAQRSAIEAQEKKMCDADPDMQRLTLDRDDIRTRLDAATKAVADRRAVVLSAITSASDAINEGVEKALERQIEGITSEIAHTLNRRSTFQLPLPNGAGPLTFRVVSIRETAPGRPILMQFFGKEKTDALYQDLRDRKVPAFTPLWPGEVFQKASKKAAAAERRFAAITKPKSDESGDTHMMDAADWTTVSPAVAGVGAFQGDGKVLRVRWKSNKTTEWPCTPEKLTEFGDAITAALNGTKEQRARVAAILKEFKNQAE